MLEYHLLLLCLCVLNVSADKIPNTAILGTNVQQNTDPLPNVHVEKAFADFR